MATNPMEFSTQNEKKNFIQNIDNKNNEQKTVDTANEN